MARGGRREGAGGRPAWKYGKTKPVRVPIALAAKILEIAKILDEGKFEDSDNLEEFEELVTASKVIDLTGIAILYSKDGPVVRLADLVRVGYEIRPERLVRNLKAKPSEPLSLDGLLSTLEKENERNATL
jgi:hypothetical protein